MKIEQVYKKYAKDLFRYCLSISKDRAVAEDTVGETFEKLLKQSDINTSSVKSWLFTVASNSMKNYFRDHAKYSYKTDISWIKDDYQKTEEEKTIEDAEAKEVRNIFDELAADYKQVIVLKVWEDYKFTEIAKIVGISQNTAKTKYYRGLSLIRDKLAANTGKPKNMYSSSAILLVLANYAYTPRFNLTNLISTKAMQDNNTLNSGLTSAAGTGTSKLTIAVSIFATAAVAVAVTIPTSLFIAQRLGNDQENFSEQTTMDNNTENSQESVSLEEIESDDSQSDSIGDESTTDDLATEQLSSQREFISAAYPQVNFSYDSSTWEIAEDIDRNVTSGVEVSQTSENSIDILRNLTLTHIESGETLVVRQTAFGIFGFGPATCENIDYLDTAYQDIVINREPNRFESTGFNFELDIVKPGNPEFETRQFLFPNTNLCNVMKTEIQVLTPYKSVNTESNISVLMRLTLSSIDDKNFVRDATDIVNQLR